MQIGASLVAMQIVEDYPTHVSSTTGKCRAIHNTLDSEVCSRAMAQWALEILLKALRGHFMSGCSCSSSLSPSSN